jgi:hypothetical protein
VRKAEQVELLRSQGAEHVVNSSDNDFMAQLRAAIDAADAYLGFDPIGGGKTVDTCFKAMEQVAVSKMTDYSRYGSNQSKKMYIYGRLDLSPTILTPSYGFGWTLGGWLLTPFLQSAGLETVMRMRQRVLDGPDHHLRQPLLRASHDGRDAAQRRGVAVQQDADGREVPGAAGRLTTGRRTPAGSPPRPAPRSPAAPATGCAPWRDRGCGRR